MSRSLALSLVVLSIPTLALAQDGETYFPLEAGRTWPYRMEGSKDEVVWKVGEKRQIVIDPVAGGGNPMAWVIEGDLAGTIFVVEKERGVVLAMERRIGFAATPAIVPVAEFRWEDESWEFQTADGCILHAVSCSRKGTESVTVPAGEFECLRLEIGDVATYWLARGVGVVRRSDRSTGAEVVLALAEARDAPGRR